MKSFLYQGRSACRGFTLVELLVVMAIIVTLTGLAANMVKTSINTLGVSAEEMAALVEQARSEAIARNQPVQLRLVTRDTANPMNAGRLFSLWAPQRSSDGQIVFDTLGDPVFSQIMPWKQLRGGVSVIGQGAQWFNSGATDLAGVNIFDESAVRPENILNGTMMYQGHTITQAMILEFKPDGSIRCSPTDENRYYYFLMAQCKGSAGDISSRAAEVSGTNTRNWRQVRLSKMTGQIHVNAP